MGTLARLEGGLGNVHRFYGLPERHVSVRTWTALAYLPRVSARGGTVWVFWCGVVCRNVSVPHACAGSSSVCRIACGLFCGLFCCSGLLLRYAMRYSIGGVLSVSGGWCWHEPIPQWYAVVWDSSPGVLWYWGASTGVFLSWGTPVLAYSIRSPGVLWHWGTLVLG